jgi:hypothetical protein
MPNNGAAQNKPVIQSVTPIMRRGFPDDVFAMRHLLARCICGFGRTRDETGVRVGGTEHSVFGRVVRSRPLLRYVEPAPFWFATRRRSDLEGGPQGRSIESRMLEQPEMPGATASRTRLRGRKRGADLPPTALG